MFCFVLGFFQRGLREIKSTFKSNTAEKQIVYIFAKLSLYSVNKVHICRACYCKNKRKKKTERCYNIYIGSVSTVLGSVAGNPFDSLFPWRTESRESEVLTLKWETPLEIFLLFFFGRLCVLLMAMFLHCRKFQVIRFTTESYVSCTFYFILRLAWRRLRFTRCWCLLLCEPGTDSTSTVGERKCQKCRILALQMSLR